MYKIKYSTGKIIFVFYIVFSNESLCRKYDVEQEAEKLYGEDFKSVLKRFRRTPDYLKILQEKKDELDLHIAEMGLQVLHYYNGKMMQRVTDIIGVTRNYNDDTTPAVYFHARDGRRQDGSGSDEKEGNEEEEEARKRGIKQLDSYHMFNLDLSVQERNNFRDLGFEIAGNVIHTIIHNMGPVDTPPKSTRLPYGGDNVRDDKTTPTTTEHPHTHEVTATTERTPLDMGVDGETTTESFRFRNPWKRMEKFFSRWENKTLK